MNSECIARVEDMWDSTLAFMRSPVQRKNAAMRRTGRASSRKDILLDHISPVQRKNAN
ncbi:MAG: hypothetical protein HFH75_03205 [Lachnospiraceae bacterium]|nr:hypothetical protein [Lachnospiraceae bacterium]